MANLKENKAKVLSHFGVSAYSELPETFTSIKFFSYIERTTHARLWRVDRRRAEFWAFLVTVLPYYNSFLKELPSIELHDKLDFLKGNLRIHLINAANYRKRIEQMDEHYEVEPDNRAVQRMRNKYQTELGITNQNIENIQNAILELELESAQIATSEPVYAKPFFLSLLQEEGGEGDKTNHCQRVTFELAPGQTELVKGCCKEFKVLVKNYTSSNYGCDFTRYASDTMTLSQADEIVRRLFKDNEDANAFYSKTSWDVEHTAEHPDGVMIEVDYHELARPYHYHCLYNCSVHQHHHDCAKLPFPEGVLTLHDPERCYG